MSGNTRLISKKGLAVSLAAIMLLSMVGMAFTAAAQTGGTFDGAIEEEVDIGDFQNVDEDEVFLLGQDGDFNFTDDGDFNQTDSNVTVEDDGSINISEDAAAVDDGGDAFAGVGVSADRVADLFDLEDPEDYPTDFLQNVDNVSVDGINASVAAENDSYPAIFIEFDPQSDFSQINITDDRVDGTHDYIVIHRNESTGGDAVNVTSVNNDDPSENTVLTQNESFGDAIDALVGDGVDNEHDLQDEHIDSVLFAGGVGLTDVTNAEETYASQISNLTLETDDDELMLHSEKITLVDDDDDMTYHPSVSDAINASEDGDDIVVDRGEYQQFEENGELINASVDAITIEAGDRVTTDAIEDRVNEDGDGFSDRDNEAVLGVQVDLNATGVTLDGVAIENDSNPALNISTGDADVENTVINYTATDTAVEVDLAAADVDFDSVALLADDPLAVDEGDTGLNASEDADGMDVENSLFVGFESQIDAVGTDLNLTEVFQDNLFEDDDRAQSAVPFDDDGNVVGEYINGSIDEADNTAEDGNTLEVSIGFYDDGDTVDIETDEIDVVSVGDGNVTVNASDGIDVDSDEAFGLEGVDLDQETNLSVTGDDPAVSIEDVTLLGGFDAATGIPDTPSGNISITDASEVTVEYVEIENLGVDNSAAFDQTGIDVDTETESTTVREVDIRHATQGAGVNLTGTATDWDSVTVSSVTVEGSDVTAVADDIDLTAVNVSDVTTGEPEAEEGSEITIADNTLTGLGNGTGLILNESADVDDGEVALITVENNELRGGEEFIGIEYDLDETLGVTLFNNEIIGENVRGGDESVGILIKAIEPLSDAPVFGTPDPDELVTFEENTITGHAQLVNDSSEEFETSDYDALLDDLNNTFGTLVINEDLDYEESFGDIDEQQTYLPGSLAEAANLVEELGELDETEVQVFDPEVGVADTPASYVDEEVVFPDIDSLVIAGEDDDITVETNFVIDADASAKNNHELHDLTIVNEDTAAAIDVDQHNAQVVFDNLDVTSDGAGVVANATGDDVNVIEITDSTFDVAADGLDLTGYNADADDRDGFVIENVDLYGPGLDVEADGLNLTGIEKPGKENPELDEDLTISGLTLDNFSTQLNLTDNALDTDVEEIYNDEVDVDRVTIEDVTFEQAVFVLNHSALETDGDEIYVADNESVYGSIQTAYEAGSAGDGLPADPDVDMDAAVIDVGASLLAADEDNVATGVYDHDADLTLGVGYDDFANVTVHGPQAGVDAREDRGDEVTIPSELNVTNTDEPVTVDGFDIVLDNEDALDSPGVAGASNVTNVTTITDRGGDIGGAVTIANTSISHDIDLAHANFTANVTGVGVDASDTVHFEQVLIDDGDGYAQAPNASGMVLDTDEQVYVNDTDVLGVAGDAIDILGDNAELNYVTIEDVAEETDPQIEAPYDQATRAGSGHGVNATGATSVYVFDSTIENVHDSGVNVTESAGVAVNASTISEAGVHGIDIDTDEPVNVTSGAVVTDAYYNAVNVTEASGGINLTSSTFSDSNVGLYVEDVDDFGDADVLGNTIVDNEEAEIELAEDESGLNITLNYFGDRAGPLGDDAAGLKSDDPRSDFVRDPFLTEDLAGDSLDDINATTSFAHDIVIPTNEVVSIGFPAQLEGDGPGQEPTLRDLGLADIDGVVYAFQDGQFTSVDDFDEDVEAFDAFVVWSDDDDDKVVPVEYASSPEDDGFPIAEAELEEGLNFLPAPRAGNVSEVLFDGFRNDVVQERFGPGEDLYGVDTDATAAGFASPDLRFSESFAGNASQQELHPHVGYLITVQEESAGTIIPEAIFPGVQADQIEDETDRTDD